MSDHVFDPRIHDDVVVMLQLSLGHVVGLDRSRPIGRGGCVRYPGSVAAVALANEY